HKRIARVRFRDRRRWVSREERLESRQRQQCHLQRRPAVVRGRTETRYPSGGATIGKQIRSLLKLGNLGMPVGCPTKEYKKNCAAGLEILDCTEDAVGRPRPSRSMAGCREHSYAASRKFWDAGISDGRRTRTTRAAGATAATSRQRDVRERQSIRHDQPAF